MKVGVLTESSEGFPQVAEVFEASTLEEARAMLRDDYPFLDEEPTLGFQSPEDEYSWKRGKSAVELEEERSGDVMESEPYYWGLNFFNLRQL